MLVLFLVFYCLVIDFNFGFNKIQDRWSEWFAKFEGGFLIQHLAKIPSGYVDKNKADEVEAWYKTLSGVEACQRSMKQCVETIRESAAWKARAWGEIVEWCKENGTNEAPKS